MVGRRLGGVTRTTRANARYTSPADRDDQAQNSDRPPPLDNRLSPQRKRRSYVASVRIRRRYVLTRHRDARDPVPGGIVQKGAFSVR